MFRRLGLRKSIALVLVVALGLGYTPGSVYSTLASAMVHTVGSVAVPPKAADPIRDAVLNVTTDFDELTHLLCEFMRSQSQETRQHFQEFMGHKATRSYPRLEGVLDWLLSLYKFVFPFLIISMVAKLSGSQEGEGQSEDALDGTAQGGYGEEFGAAAGGGHTSAALLRKQPSGRGAGEDLLAGRLPSKVLSKSPSLGPERGVPAPSTPMEGGSREARHPLHPAQLQRGASQRQQEIHAYTRAAA